ncbi:hypothetical protein MMC27_008789 [Xylographa pallens]|nr:hypothetical protein [Xylographa pallens]
MAIGPSEADGSGHGGSTKDLKFLTDHSVQYRQDPIAVIGMANRLPGDCNNPSQLWDFLEQGGVAQNDPPESRFSLKGHYDKSLKPHTIRTPGAMFLENVDPADFDAAFFQINKADAIAMDPQQRQLLEVVYESFENAGLTMQQISGALFGCFVGSYAVDYQDMQFRDPEDRATGITVGAGRAILSNRISHFFNMKGASMTIDTACSGSLVSVDVACRYLQMRQINGAVVAGANLYLSPDQNQDMGAMRVTSSATGKCHTFDAKADGYCKAEAINAVLLKRLDDAIRDGDPIRAVIRGTATNSDGRTPGIASPDAEAQATAIRAAYSAAGLTTFNHTGYLECHGTGTLAGDPIEVSAAASVFSPTRPAESPLIIGSIKSNIGHSEPAAGVNGLIKAVLAVEKGIIPGNPTFIDPNPKIDFKALKVRATRTAIPWPNTSARIASVNSFGYGGSNAHVVLQDAESFCHGSTKGQVSSRSTSRDDFFADNTTDISMRPQLLVFSANDEASLKGYCSAMKKFLINPSTDVKLSDLSYTLSEKRTRHFNRAYVTTSTTDFDEGALVYGKRNMNVPRIGFVFTGQGAQWSQMGKGLLDTFPAARRFLKRLDDTLQGLPTPPQWLLSDELVKARSPDHLRRPEFSQPLVTALQLTMLFLLQSWGVSAQSVVGHSSGEIAAACAARLLTPEDAIMIAYFRGQAAKDLQDDTEEGLGMLAVGLGAEAVKKYILDSADLVQIACYNSPDSVTLSGKVSELEKVKSRLQTDSHFARMLQVNLAYHSEFMARIGEHYEMLLKQNVGSLLTGNKSTAMFSSVTGEKMNEAADAGYWKRNMVSPVLFDKACQKMLSGREGADFLIEIGPSGALAGPISQIKKDLPGQGAGLQYYAAAKRGPDSALSMFEVAGRMFVSGGDVDLSRVNSDEPTTETVSPALIVDLPNYVWNHSIKYWHESDASKDWRFRPFVHHDLLGSKVLGTPWHTPTFKKILDLKDLPWLRDHKMGSDILFPASGYIALAMEALYQSSQSTNPIEGVTLVDQLCYRLRNIKFDKALVLEENVEAKIMLTLSAHPGTKDTWYDFKVFSTRDEARNEHCNGLIRLEEPNNQVACKADLTPLKHVSHGQSWYKALINTGYSFGPLFQKVLAVESTSGKRESRSHVDLTEPPSAWAVQSLYPMHPACIDGCFQTVTPSLWAGNRSAVDQVLVPAGIDSLVIYPASTRPRHGVSMATSQYTGRGRQEENKSYSSSCSVYDPETGGILLQLTGLRYHKLDTGGKSHAADAYSRSVWNPDITLITQDQISTISNEHDGSSLHHIIDLVAYKKPNLRVAEIDLSANPTSSLWFREDRKLSRAAYSQCVLASVDAKSLVSLQTQYDQHRNTSFSLLDMTRNDFELADGDFDLIIVKQSTFSKEVMPSVIRNTRGLLSNGGFALFVEPDMPTTDSDSDDHDVVVVRGNGPLNGEQLTGLLNTHGFQNSFKIPDDTVKSAYLAKAEFEADSVIKPKITLVRLVEDTPTVSRVKASLQRLGWEIAEQSYPFHDIQPNSTFVILDEVATSLLTSVSKDQWEALKNVIIQGRKVLWVTEGSQFKVSKPDKALIHGLLRTVRAEDKSLNLTTLDVESSESPSTVPAIHSVLTLLEKSEPTTQVESEFVERSGIIHVNRILSDHLINQFKNEEIQGKEAILKSLHEIDTTARLRSERLGTLDALMFGEISTKELPVKDNNVEVEIFAAGLNFKDVAVTMGIVPENEHLLGLEGAGIIRRIGKGVSTYKIGDRVAILRNGTFANRLEVPLERTHHIPNSMSFEDAATIPLVYLTSMYSLFNLANIQRGQSVLIHSAAGGVGIACIQLAKYAGAEIYVTVGTEAKRAFLQSIFGIPTARIFSSRTTRFASEIMKATHGKGVDVIINSLTGELLDETWRICADGGNMIEIGKKDIVDRNHLSMEPFDRNCSFRPLDFSHKQITDEMIGSLLRKVFKLVAEGHIGPIHPIKTFSFKDIAASFAYMRSGRHIGKIVITDGEKPPQIILPVRPAQTRLNLKSNVAYLIVGGLKGLCGSLAIYMAQHGAKYLIAMSRSGCDDDRSQGVIRNCEALGCQVQDARADVSNAGDVRRAFKQALVPIGGVIQGAMVLNDKPYETMTADEYHRTISVKVQGTWNLHNAALEQAVPLDFFTLLSSVSGIVGQKGQANYAAANVFLDAFASYRHSLHLPAHSVDLGVIEDVGYVAEQGGMQSHFDKRQWIGINEATLRKIFGYSILQQTEPIHRASAGQLITGIPLPLPEDSELLRDARFAGLFTGGDVETGSKSGSDASKDMQTFFLLHRSGADAAVLMEAALEVVNKQFTRTLRLEEPMEPAKSLATYGLDSLSAVEIRNWIRTEMGAEITLLEIVNASSLYVLCEKIVAKIPPATGKA